MLNFIKYNNALPIALGILFLGGGSAFAASNPQAVYSAKQKVVSVDNTYLVRANLARFTPRIDIIAVTEDADTYYVSYELSTIDVADSVWRDVVKKGTLQVSKELLAGRDLGLFATAQLRDLISHEEDRLKESQDIARKQVSQKQVATVYGGLVGTFLNDSTETLPGYTPVIPEPVDAPTEPYTPIKTAGAQDADNNGGSASGGHAGEDIVTNIIIPPDATSTEPMTEEQTDESLSQQINELVQGGTATSTPPTEAPPAQ